MTKTPRLTVAKSLALISLITVLPGSVFAAQTAIDADAAERVRASMSYLAGLKQFALDTDTTIEVVLESGQKIQFDNAVVATVQRPNKMLAVRKGDLVNQEFLYDGASLTLHDVDAGFYATVPAPDTLEGMLDFARESLDIVAPAGDFLYANAYDILMQDVQSGFIVGTTYIEGVACDHLAFSAPHVDWQIWVQQGDTPLPRKLVITSRDVLNAPQFTVRIKNWNLSPDVSDELFQFVKPEEAVAIEFITLSADAE